MRKRTRTLALVTAVVLALSGCGGGQTETASGESSSDTLTVGNFYDKSGWDPALYTGGFDLPYFSAVYDPLLTLDSKGQPQAALAKDWSWNSSKTVLTMDLRNDATFSDGTTFDADVAVANINHLRAKDSLTAPNYQNVTSVAKVDDDTIRLTLSKPDSSLLYEMGWGASFMASSKAISSNSFTKPDGSGPYTYEASKSTNGSSYKFVKKSSHWDSSAFPYKNVTITVTSDPTASYNAVSSGQVDVILGNASTEQKARQAGLNISSIQTIWFGLMYTDRAGKIDKPLGNVKVREAINKAFDRKAILKSLGQGNGTVTNQVYPISGDIYDKSLESYDDYNVSEAKKLLSEAGYPNGFTITMPMSPGFQSYQAITKQSLAKIGITVKWDTMSQADYQAKIGNYGMFLCNYTMQSNDYMNTRMHFGDNWLNPQLSLQYDKTAEALWEKIQQSTGSEQTALIRKLNTYLTKNYWADVWYQSSDLYFSSSNVKVTGQMGVMFPSLRNILPKS